MRNVKYVYILPLGEYFLEFFFISSNRGRPWLLQVSHCSEHRLISLWQ